MEQTNSRSRIHKEENPQTVTLNNISATFIAGKKILINFSDGRAKMVDFAPLFKKYVKGDFCIFAEPAHFKNFKIEGGNLFWGENEDVIFSAQTLYDSRHSKIVEEEILYVL